LRSAIAGTWQQRDDHYSELRGQGMAPADTPRVEMSYIGG